MQAPCLENGIGDEINDGYRACSLRIPLQSSTYASRPQSIYLLVATELKT